MFKFLMPTNQALSKIIHALTDMPQGASVFMAKCMVHALAEQVLSVQSIKTMNFLLALLLMDI